jgi:hypothetical protein
VQDIWNLCKSLGKFLMPFMVLGFRLLFFDHPHMCQTPSGRKTLVVQYKKCRRDVPSDATV